MRFVGKFLWFFTSELAAAADRKFHHSLTLTTKGAPCVEDPFESKGLCFKNSQGADVVSQELSSTAEKTDVRKFLINGYEQDSHILELVNTSFTDFNTFNYSRWSLTSVHLGFNPTCAEVALILSDDGGLKHSVLHEQVRVGQDVKLSGGDIAKITGNKSIVTYPSINLHCVAYDKLGKQDTTNCRSCNLTTGAEKVTTVSYTRVWRKWHDLWDFKLLKGLESITLADCEKRANWRDYTFAGFRPGPERDACLKKYLDRSATVLVRSQLSKGLSDDLRDPTLFGSNLTTKILEVDRGSGLHNVTAYVFSFNLSQAGNKNIPWEITEIGVSKKGVVCLQEVSIYLSDKPADQLLRNLNVLSLTPIRNRKGGLIHGLYDDQRTLTHTRSSVIYSGKEYTLIVLPSDKCAVDTVEPLIYAKTVFPAPDQLAPTAITSLSNRHFRPSVYRITSELKDNCKPLPDVYQSMNSTFFETTINRILNRDNLGTTCKFIISIRMNAAAPVAPIAISSKPDFVRPGTGSSIDPLSEWFDESYPTYKDLYTAPSFVFGNEGLNEIPHKALKTYLFVSEVDFKATLSESTYHPEKCGTLALYYSEVPQETLFPYFPYERFSLVERYKTAPESTVFTNVDLKIGYHNQFIILPSKEKFDKDPTSLECLLTFNSAIIPAVEVSTLPLSVEELIKDLA